MSRLGRGAVSIALAGALACAGCEGADVTRVVDADHLVVKGHKIALYGVDVPDAAKPACDLEKQAADLAHERLEGMILAAKDVSFRKTGMACLQFMTCDGFVMADGVDVGEALIAEGLAARKEGETARDWCVPVAAPPPPIVAAPDIGPAPPPQDVTPAQPQTPNDLQTTPPAATQPATPPT